METPEEKELQKTSQPDKKEKENKPIPIAEALPQIKQRIQEFINRYGNVVVIIEGAWATGKSTFSRIFKDSLENVFNRSVTLVIIDQDPHNATPLLPRNPSLYKGKNLISVLSTHTHNS